MPGERNEVTKRIHERGMTLTGWCRLNGFNPAVVNGLLCNEKCRRSDMPNKGSVATAVFAALKRDGFMPDPFTEDGPDNIGVT